MKSDCDVVALNKQLWMEYNELKTNEIKILTIRKCKRGGGDLHFPKVSTTGRHAPYQQSKSEFYL